MTKSRTPPAWRRAFLRELSRSGSVAGAAERCGIDRTSAYQLRNRNAAFAASWQRAVERARERLSATSAHPEETPPFVSSEVETPVRGLSTTLEANGCGGASPKRPILRPDETVRASKSGRVCIARVGPGRWSAKGEAAFLAELTASANVRAAARAAGVSAQAAYNRRKLWPAFKAEWDLAVAEGHARIETLLVCAATTTLDPEPLPERAWDAPQMSMDQALKLHLAHRAAEQGARRGGPPRREPDIEEVRAEILRKVAAMERAGMFEEEGRAAIVEDGKAVLSLEEKRDPGSSPG